MFCLFSRFISTFYLNNVFSWRAKLMYPGWRKPITEWGLVQTSSIKNPMKIHFRFLMENNHVARHQLTAKGPTVNKWVAKVMVTTNKGGYWKIRYSTAVSILLYVVIWSAAQLSTMKTKDIDVPGQLKPQPCWVI